MAQGRARPAALAKREVPSWRVAFDDAERDEASLGHGEGEQEKPVVYLKELEKGAVLGPTTADQLTHLFGTDETEAWVGKRVVVFNDTNVRYRGKVGGVRFRTAPLGEDELPV